MKAVAVFPSRLERNADAYLVARGDGRTIVAGYPWFTDGGGDTFIALRGLCLATGRFADARAILLAWAGAVSEGMVPNRFPDRGDVPELNAVDAALWRDLDEAGLGHVSEIAEGDPPHTPAAAPSRRGPWGRLCASTASCSRRRPTHDHPASCAVFASACVTGTVAGTYRAA